MSTKPVTMLRSTILDFYCNKSWKFQLNHGKFQDLAPTRKVRLILDTWLIVPEGMSRLGNIREECSVQKRHLPETDTK